MSKVKSFIRRIFGGEQASNARVFEEETIARNLFSFLSETFEQASPVPEIEVEGGGVHWQVNVSVTSRGCRVHCFHYGDSPGDLHLGPRGNVHLRNVETAPPPPAYEGPEYLVCFTEGGGDAAEGRTTQPAEVASCLEQWLLKESAPDEIYRAFPFVDRNRRAQRALAAVIDSRLADVGSTVRTTAEQDYGGDVGIELWIYADKKSCRVAPAHHLDAVGCAFLSLGTQLANVTLETASETATAVEMWVHQSLSLDELQQQITNLQLASFAKEFERGEIANWHWSNVLVQAREEVERGDDGVLAYYLPVLERIVENPTTKRFFSFTSLNRLCFSRCSHFPFATEDMPMLTPIAEGYRAECGADVVDGDAQMIFDFLLAKLSSISDPPFHGCAADALIAPVNSLLHARGATVRAKRVQRRQWSDVLVSSVGRRCTLDTSGVEAAPYSLSVFENDSDRLSLIT